MAPKRNSGNCPMCGQHVLSDPERIHNRVVIDNAEWLLGVANNDAFLCENILERGAECRYIVEREFAPFFQALQKQLGPLVFGDDWKGPR